MILFTNHLIILALENMSKPQCLRPRRASAYHWHKAFPATTVASDQWDIVLKFFYPEPAGKLQSSLHMTFCTKESFTAVSAELLDLNPSKPKD